MSDPLMRVSELRKSFGDNAVLKGVDLEIFPRDVVVIIGPSGCGKSTFLRCLNQLEAPTSGQVTFKGQVVKSDPQSLQALRAQVGMVFQRFHLFPHLTVMENLLLAPQVVKGDRSPDLKAKAQETLEMVGLGDRGESYPDALSGGQQQRVAIARSLMMEPEMLLFDEPTSALDPELVGEVLMVMKGLAAEGRTMCVVTHEMDFARAVATRVVMLDAGQIVEEGPPEALLGNPQHPRTQQFLSRLTHRL